MATKNRRVAAYLPGDIEEAFSEFKEGNGLNESQALIAILAEFFGLSTSKIASASIVERIQALEAIRSESADRLQKLEEEIHELQPF